MTLKRDVGAKRVPKEQQDIMHALHLTDCPERAFMLEWYVQKTFHQGIHYVCTLYVFVTCE